MGREGGDGGWGRGGVGEAYSWGGGGGGERVGEERGGVGEGERGGSGPAVAEPNPSTSGGEPTRQRPRGDAMGGTDGPRPSRPPRARRGASARPRRRGQRGGADTPREKERTPSERKSGQPREEERTPHRRRNHVATRPCGRGPRRPRPHPATTTARANGRARATGCIAWDGWARALKGGIADQWRGTTYFLSLDDNFFTDLVHRRLYLKKLVLFFSSGANRKYCL